jgi:hypothetical protein
MSNYPNGKPSESLEGIWISGDFTPAAVCVHIIDNVMPVNKNTMVNSVGKEISSIQNFVNKDYLGRYSSPVNSGFIKKFLMPDTSQEYPGPVTVNITGLMVSGDGYGNVDFNSYRGMTFYTNYGRGEDINYALHLDAGGEVTIPTGNFSSISCSDGVFSNISCISGNFTDVSGSNIIQSRVLSCTTFLTETGYLNDGNIQVHLNVPNLTISGDSNHTIFNTTSEGNIKFYFGNDKGYPGLELSNDGTTHFHSGVIIESDFAPKVSGFNHIGYPEKPFGNMYSVALEVYDYNTSDSVLRVSGDGYGNTVIRNPNHGIYFFAGENKEDPNLKVDSNGEIRFTSGAVVCEYINPVNSGTNSLGNTEYPFGKVYATGLILQDIVSYTSNADAISNGAPIGTIYRSGDYLCIVH